MTWQIGTSTIAETASAPILATDLIVCPIVRISCLEVCGGAAVRVKPGSCSVEMVFNLDYCREDILSFGLGELLVDE
mgnify:CR=1 FL=1